MKAINLKRYGAPETCFVREADRPIPKADELLIRVRASSLNKADMHIMNGIGRFMGFGLLKPNRKIPGCDFAGTVEAVGESVSGFKLGDTVFGDASNVGQGAFAEFLALPTTCLTHMPQNLSFEAAACVPLAATTALQALRDSGQLRAGQKVLINGASGGVGLFAVQLAKHWGAEVTAVCSTRHLALLHQLGADHLVDYTQTDCCKGNQQYDLVLAINGTQSVADYKPCMKNKSTLVFIGGSFKQIFSAMAYGWFARKNAPQQLKLLSATCRQADLSVLKEIIEAGALVPQIDHTYALDELPDAFRHMLGKHVQGKLAIRMPLD